MATLLSIRDMLSCGTSAVDEVEELADFFCAVAPCHGGDDVAGAGVELGVEVGGSIAAVGVSAPLGSAGHKRQDRRGAIESRDLGFLIDAEHYRCVGRVQIRPDRCRGPSTNCRSGEIRKFSVRSD